MLAFYLDKQIYEELRYFEKIIKFNITLISTPEANNNYKETNIELNK
jgi:hypothetical protein